MAMTTTLQIRTEVETAVLFKSLTEKLGTTQGTTLAMALKLLDAALKGTPEAQTPEERARVWLDAVTVPNGKSSEGGLI